jgi:hypothetical protein
MPAQAPLMPELAAALGELAEVVRDARDPWWLIGSAAMALHGAGPLEVGDIDLLMSRADAALLLERLGVPGGLGTAHDKFRSEVFGQWQCRGYTVEVLGGFHVHDGTRWREVVPRDRVAVSLIGAVLFVPSLDDLIEMCRLFGRPKDAERERLLRSLDPPRDGEVAREA